MDNNKRRQIERTRIPPFSKAVYDKIAVQLLRDISPELDDFHFAIDFGYYAQVKTKKNAE